MQVGGKTRRPLISGTRIASSPTRILVHTLGKPVLLLAQAKKDIPFDLGHLRFIIYTPDGAGLAELKSKIIQRLRGARAPQNSTPDL